MYKQTVFALMSKTLDSFISQRQTFFIFSASDFFVLLVFSI